MRKMCRGQTPQLPLRVGCCIALSCMLPHLERLKSPAHRVEILGGEHAADLFQPAAVGKMSKQVGNTVQCWQLSKGSWRACF